MKHGGKRYLKTIPEGWIHVVKEFGPSWQKMDWDRFPIEELQRMECVGGFFEVYFYEFHSWKALKKFIREIGASQFLYGKVTFKIH